MWRGEVFAISDCLVLVLLDTVFHSHIAFNMSEVVGCRYYTPILSNNLSPHNHDNRKGHLSLIYVYIDI